MSNFDKASRIESQIREVQDRIRHASKKAQECTERGKLREYAKWDRKGRKLGRKEDRLRKQLRRLLP
ncbi:hypothetical protein [Sciscionella marina]|uniref:hypothetical protein n=1 Tax=Sciscionella marina TaxID=508770 RepID=UPI00035D9108|nr:hypothetical protein [Sciscionella marina]